MPVTKLSLRGLKSIKPVTKPTIFYDEDLTGFGLKVLPTGARSWLIEYRPGEGGRRVSKRRMVFGTPKNLTPEQARQRASGLLAEVRFGSDPAASRREARAAESVKELMAAFMDNHVRPKRKPATVRLFQGYIRNHIEPVLGSKKAPALTYSAVERLHKRVGVKSPVTANRVVALIAAAYSYGFRAKIVPRQVDNRQFENPALGVERFVERTRERYLSDKELSRLGDAIRLAETAGIRRPPSKSKHSAKKLENLVIKIEPHAAAALRLLIFTGARLREILDLEWDHVDLQRGLLFLPDSKTGKKTIVLGAPALAIITNLKPVGRFVIAGNELDKPRSDLKRPWALVSRQAGLTGLRLHDLRHSFASVGVGDSLGLPIIGKLLGHKNAKTTERYAHLAVDPLRRAADTIGNKIARAMGEKTAGTTQ
jgi:integrase